MDEYIYIYRKLLLNNKGKNFVNTSFSIWKANVTQIRYNSIIQIIGTLLITQNLA